MAVLKANGSFLKANGKILVKPEGGGNTVVIGGRAYPFVQIGRQLWITENLDWKKSAISIGGGQTSNPTAWYYNNDEATFGYNGNKFGLLYNYAAAEIIKDGLTNGWRISSEDDCNRLKKYVADDGNKLKSIQYWNTPGNNDTGFNMYPSGFRGSSFDEYGIYGYLRTDTIYSGTQVSFAHVVDNGTIYVGPYSSGNVGLPIRVCKDATVNIGGRDYPTTKIGSQIFLAEDLQLASNSGNVGFYNKADKDYFANNSSTLFPQGWRMMDSASIQKLKTDLNNPPNISQLLRSTTGWTQGNGTDNFGFNAMPTGYINSGGNHLEEGNAWLLRDGINGHHWLNATNNDFSYWSDDSNTISCKFPIRLVKDA